MQSRLAVSLLGPPQIERDGVPIRVDRRKAIALLAYLVVTGESHRRDSLVNLLWPEFDATTGRAALRRTLYALRSALEGPWLAADRDEIGVAPGVGAATGARGTLWVDVTQFRQQLAVCRTHGHPASQVCAACLPPLTEAVAFFRGDFMAGFSLKDSVNFDDWQLLQSQTLRSELAGALERLVRGHSTQRKFELAVGYAKRRLALDPLDEGTHRQLMRLHAWCGRRSAALRQYAECEAILDSQLEVPPEPDTMALFQAIKAGQIPPAPPAERRQTGYEALVMATQTSPQRHIHPGAAQPQIVEGEDIAEPPVFVARERELARLDHCLQEALSGRGNVLLITGDAGCGKTALIQAFARRAQGAHPDLVFATGYGNAHTGIGDPYLPFREILGLLTGDVAAPLATGAMTREQAGRLTDLLPLAIQALIRSGPDLIGLFVPGPPLLERAEAAQPWPGDPASLAQLADVAARSPASIGLASRQQIALFAQYARVLEVLAARHPLLLALDDLQWADGGSLNLLFHLGRKLAGQRILVLAAFRPAEVALGRPSTGVDTGPAPGQPDWGTRTPRERHPLEPVVNEFKRAFGGIEIDLEEIDGRRFIDALLESEPNRLSSAFRDALFRRTRGHPLFTVELLRGMQERGDLLHDAEGKWIEGAALDWDTLPARAEAVIGERIARLPEDLRQLLRVASVEGDSFTAEVVAQVQGTGMRELVRSLSDTLDRKHRLVSARGIDRLGGRTLSHYSFRHSLYQRYLYGSLDAVEKAYLHEQVGTVLEDICGTVETGSDEEADGMWQMARANVAAYAPQLARHFEEAGIPEKAIPYLRQAGERAIQLAAHREAISHLNKGLAMLQGASGPGAGVPRFQRDEEELRLQLALGLAWMSSAAPGLGAEAAYKRARELCMKRGKTSKLFAVLVGLAVVRYVWGEHRRALELASEALRLAEAAQDPLLSALGHWCEGVVHFALGQYESAHHHLAQTIAFYHPEQHHERLVRFFAADGGLSAMAYDACCLWCLGYPDQALERSREALDVARGLGHAFTFADVLTFAGCLHSEMRREAEALQVSAEELENLAKESGFPGWLTHAICLSGQALVMLGHFEQGVNRIHEGVAARRSLATLCGMPGLLRCLAEGQASSGQRHEAFTSVAEGLALVEETGERQEEAELHRVRAELLLMQGEYSGAEASLQTAIHVAREQRARSWELRATISLARMRKSQGRYNEAREALSRIYDWFTEGFDTPDLIDARALLQELA